MAENKLVNASIIFIAIVVLAIVLKTFAKLFRPFAIAIILVFLLMPLMRLCKRKKIPFGISIVGIILILIIGFSLVAVLLNQEEEKIDDALPKEHNQKLKENLLQFKTWASNINIFGYKLNLDSVLNTDKISQYVSGWISTIIQKIGSIISEIFLAILFLIFILPSIEMIFKNIEKGLNKKETNQFKDTIQKIEQSIQDYLVTKTYISLATAIVSAIVLMMFGSDFVVILAFLIFILNYIPNIGSIIAVFIALTIYLITYGFGWQIIVLGLILISIQMFFGSFLEPKIAGQKLKISPIIILLSLFIWYWIWGIVGMLLAVPIASIIKITLGNIAPDKKMIDYLK